MSPATVDFVVAAAITGTVFGPPGIALTVWALLNRRRRAQAALDREIAEIENWLANIRNTA